MVCFNCHLSPLYSNTYCILIPLSHDDSLLKSSLRNFSLMALICHSSLLSPLSHFFREDPLILQGCHISNLASFFSEDPLIFWGQQRLQPLAARWAGRHPRLLSVEFARSLEFGVSGRAWSFGPRLATSLGRGKPSTMGWITLSTLVRRIPSYIVWLD